jgi:lipoyl(octanoyl) transferase
MLWRFLPFSMASAAENMAIDETILDSYVAGDAPPTLRLYGFAPSAVSLGYAQKMSRSDVVVLREQKLDVVRRPTGGRAVLHCNDLTYALIAPVRSSDQTVARSILPNGVVEAHKEICRALLFTFAQFGISLNFGRGQSNYRDCTDCFDATTSADLHFQGRKVMGSAQLRRKSALLQHGSAPLQSNQTSLKDLLKGEGTTSAKAKEEIGIRPLGLIDLAGHPIDHSELERAFKKGFEQAFGVEFFDGELSTAEKEKSHRRKSAYVLDSVTLPE